MVLAFKVDEVHNPACVFPSLMLWYMAKYVLKVERWLLALTFQSDCLIQVPKQYMWRDVECDTKRGEGVNSVGCISFFSFI